MSDSQRILLSLYLSNNEEDIFGLKVSNLLRFLSMSLQKNSTVFRETKIENKQFSARKIWISHLFLIRQRFHIHIHIFIKLQSRI